MLQNPEQRPCPHLDGEEKVHFNSDPRPLMEDPDGPRLRKEFEKVAKEDIAWYNH